MAERPADFEEAEFRGPLFNQLLRGSNLLWEPGQVFEEHIGIDFAALIEDQRFWLLRRAGFRAGAILASTELGYISKRKKTGKLLPPFALNVFIQAKRSNVKTPSPRVARAEGLASPCWFFNVESHQQKALIRLSSALQGKGLVCYAAPAFHSQAELFHHTEKRSMVENSTFPAAGSLHDHARWYYDRCGKFGVANPQFERIESLRIDAQVERLSEAHRDLLESTPVENLESLEKAINETVRDPDDISSRDTWFSLLSQSLYNEAEDVLGNVSSSLRAYLRVRSYCSAYGVEWLTLL